MDLKRYLAFLNAFSAQLGHASEPAEALEPALASVREIVACDHVSVALFTGSRSVRWVDVPAHSKTPAWPDDELELSHDSLFARAAAERRPLSGPLRWDDRGPSYASCLVLPLLVDSRPLGLLSLASIAAGVYDSDTCRLLDPVAAALAAELHRLERLAQSRRSEDESATLHKFGALLASALDVRDVFSEACELIRDYLPFDAMALLLLDSQRRSFTLFASTQASGLEGLAVGDQIPLNGTAAGRAVKGGESVVVADTEQACFPYDRALASIGVRSYLVVPLRVKAETVGTLDVFSRAPNCGRDARADLLGSIAATLAIAVDNTRLFARVRASEGRYSSLVENAADAIYRLDAHGRVSFVNRRGEELLGQSRREIVGRRWHELVHPNDVRRVDLGPLLEGPEQNATLELRLAPSSRGELLTQHRISVTRDADRVVALQGIARDIDSTQRRWCVLRSGART